MHGLGRFHLKFDPETHSSIAPRDREIVIHRTTARCHCEYEWGVHVASFAERVELLPAQVDATAIGSASDPAWSDRDRLLIELADVLHDTADVPDELWPALSAYWTGNQLLQLIVLIGWYHTISFVANAVGVPLESWGARFPGAAKHAIE
jgi:4-carboxymuconolactone decarboxylase